MQGALEWIITDKHWLLENLLCYMSNAVKFVAEGTIVIKVSAEYDSDRNNSNNEDLIAKKEIGTCQVTTSSNSNKFRTMYSVPVIPSGALPTSASNRPLLNAPDMNDNNSNYCNQLQTLKFIRFTVVDSGIGIPEDKLGGLFQPFFQAQKGAGGTGLGLYALSNRIKALQGQYGAGGREDGAQGSEFWFSIPYRPDTELNDDSVKAYEEEIKRSSLCFNRFNETTSTGRSKLGSCDVEELANHIDGDLRQNELESTQSISLITETSQLHLPRVLLVDDSTMIQKASTRALLKEGFRVTSAMNGVECLQRLKEAKESGDLYCVVLLDLQMPVLDGFETVKRIREEERLSDLEAGVVACSSTTGDGDGAAVSFPTSWSMCNSGRRQYVIGLSANSDTESIDCVAAAGMDNFIAKPLKVSTLRKVCGPQKAL
jgi:CheY-like chemotaxis protein